MVFSLCAENFRHTERASRTVKRHFSVKNQIAGYELEYPDVHSLRLLQSMGKRSFAETSGRKLETALRWKTLRRDGAEMKESMMLPAKSMVLLARE